jgi:hypothetical protein
VVVPADLASCVQTGTLGSWEEAASCLLLARGHAPTFAAVAKATNRFLDSFPPTDPSRAVAVAHCAESLSVAVLEASCLLLRVATSSARSSASSSSGSSPNDWCVCGQELFRVPPPATSSSSVTKLFRFAVRGLCATLQLGGSVPRRAWFANDTSGRVFQSLVRLVLAAFNAFLALSRVDGGMDSEGRGIQEDVSAAFVSMAPLVSWAPVRVREAFRQVIELRALEDLASFPAQRAMAATTLLCVGSLSEEWCKGLSGWPDNVQALLSLTLDVSTALVTRLQHDSDPPSKLLANLALTCSSSVCRLLSAPDVPFASRALATMEVAKWVIASAVGGDPISCGLSARLLEFLRANAPKTYKSLRTQLLACSKGVRDSHVAWRLSVMSGATPDDATPRDLPSAAALLRDAASVRAQSFLLATEAPSSTTPLDSLLTVMKQSGELSSHSLSTLGGLRATAGMSSSRVCTLPLDSWCPGEPVVSTDCALIDAWRRPSSAPLSSQRRDTLRRALSTSMSNPESGTEALLRKTAAAASAK